MAAPTAIKASKISRPDCRWKKIFPKIFMFFAKNATGSLKSALTSSQVSALFFEHQFTEFVNRLEQEYNLKIVILP